MLSRGLDDILHPSFGAIKEKNLELLILTLNLIKNVNIDIMGLESCAGRVVGKNPVALIAEPIAWTPPAQLVRACANSTAAAW
jgi:hypothetical protein